MGWYGYRELEFESERQQIEFVLKDLYGERCKLVDYERIPILPREQQNDRLDYQSEYYVAIDFSKHFPKLGTSAVVLLEKRDKNGLAYKPIEEEMGPFAFRCPLRILNKLTPNLNEQAQEWRASCRAYHLQKDRYERRPRRRSR